MKLLIVDDEIVTTEVLKEKLDRKYLGLEDIYTAYSVSMAEEILKRENIELILCDVEMPQANGLELLNWVRDNQGEVEFLFLTSHEKFEYIFGAMQKGASNYLLKPIDIPQITRALYNVIQKIRKRNQLNEVQEYWNYGKRKIMRTFFRNLLQGEISGKTEIQQELIKLGLEHVMKEKYILIFFAFRKEQILTQGKEERLNQFIIDNVLSEALTEEFEMANLIHREENEQYYVIVISDKEKEEIKKQIRIVVPILEQYYVNPVRVIYISEKKELEKLAETRNEIMDYAREHIFENGEVLLFSELKEKGEKPRKILDQKFFLQCLEKGERVKLLEYLQKNITGIQKSDSSLLRLEYFRMELLQIVGVYLHKYDMDMEFILADQAYQKLWKKSLVSIFAMIQWSVYYINKVFDERADREKGKSIVDIMVDYIHNHYEENINRNMLAELIRLSPEYVGKMFKKEMGMGISEYLNNFRIQKAQNLLSTTNYKVIDIALMVGYDNMPYFTSLFKKTVGMSPVEYKKMLKTK